MSTTAGQPLLAVENVCIRSEAGEIVHGVSFEVRAGGVLLLLGESGSGKSLIAQAILGALPPGLEANGHVWLGDQRTPAGDPRARRSGWGRRLALLPQEPWAALDPTMRVGGQLQETHRYVRGLDRAAARDKTDAALAALGLADAARAYPHQLSGGMAQRAAFAIAHAGGAPVLVVDEPTKGLDSIHKHALVEQLRSVAEAGGAVVVITHDVEVAASLGGRVAVMLEGRVVEEGETREVLAAPRHRYTQALVDAAPASWPPFRLAEAGDHLLSARGLSKHLGGKRLFENLDLDAAAGERLVIEGDSGSGKSTLGNVLLGLVDADRGTVTRRRGLPATAMQKLYQDPGAAFPPAQTLRRSLVDLARLHSLPWDRLAEPMRRMRLDDALLNRPPGDVSGGELQRLSLARVLALRPALIYADEPTSRLDPVLQREVIELIVEASSEIGAALMLVTHDRAIAERISDRRVRLPDEVA